MAKSSALLAQWAQRVGKCNIHHHESWKADVGKLVETVLVFFECEQEHEQHYKMMLEN